MSAILRPGFWCDVTVLPDGRFAHVTVQGSLVAWYFGADDTPHVINQDTPEALLFCRGACDATGALWSIHQGQQTGRAWLLVSTTRKDLGLTFGVQPVAIDATYAYIVRSGFVYDRIRLDNGAVESLPHGVPGSSQGIRDVLGGRILWADQSHVTDWQGLVLHDFVMRRDMILGQADPPMIAGAFMTGASKFTAIDGVGFEPHCCESNGRYAVCARTPRGAAYVEGPPFQALSGPPVVVPPPIVILPPVEPPMSLQAPNREDVVRAVAAQHPEIPLADEDVRGALVNYVCAALGGRPWGRKRKNNGTMNTDAIAYLRTDGQIEYYDIITSDGKPSWQGVEGPTSAGPFQPGQNGTWVEADITSPPPTQPPPTQPPSVDLSAVLAEIKLLKDRVLMLEDEAEAADDELTVLRALTIGKRLTALETKPAPKYKATGSTSRTYAHSHAINVTLEPEA